jgi:hypothetical protein
LGQPSETKEIVRLSPAFGSMVVSALSFIFGAIVRAGGGVGLLLSVSRGNRKAMRL